VATRHVRWLVENRWEQDDAPLVARRKDDRVPREPRRECAAQDRDLRTANERGSFPPRKGPRVARRGTRTARGYSTSTPRSRDPSGCCCDEASGRKRSSTVSGGKLPRTSSSRDALSDTEASTGVKSPAWLFVPRKARSRRAAVVYPHGGPGVTDSQRLGPGVSVPRRRGIHGPRSELSRPAPATAAHRDGSATADLGGGDMKDIIAGGRWLIETGKCAPDRLGAIGVSYGGYSVAHVLETGPNLWAVGVSIAILNWVTANTTTSEATCSDTTARRWVAPRHGRGLCSGNFRPSTTSTASVHPFFSPGRA